MSTTTTATQGVLDATGSGTTINLAGRHRILQLVLNDGSAGASNSGYASVTAINGVTQETTNGSIPASGIATPIISNAGINSITILPSAAGIAYWLAPIFYAGGY